jgi:hypothetical protein
MEEDVSRGTDSRIFLKSSTLLLRVAGGFLRSLCSDIAWPIRDLRSFYHLFIGTFACDVVRTTKRRMRKSLSQPADAHLFGFAILCFSFYRSVVNRGRMYEE